MRPRRTSVRGLELVCAAACLLRWNCNKPLHRTPLPSLGASSAEPACLPAPIPVPSCPFSCLCEWGCACPVSGAGGSTAGRGAHRFVSAARARVLCLPWGDLITCPPPLSCCSWPWPWGPIHWVMPASPAASPAVLFKPSVQGGEEARPDRMEMGGPLVGGKYLMPQRRG